MTSTEIRPGTVEAELEAPVRIIRPRLWAAIIALAVALAGVGSWAAWGELAQQVQATGVVVHGSGPVSARAPAAGSVVDVAVVAGQHVSPGQRVATIAAGERRTVLSPVGGTVIAVSAGPGTAVLAGSAVVAIDPTDQPPQAFAAFADRSQLGRLTVGDRVLVTTGGTTLFGRVAAIPVTPVDTSVWAQSMVIGVPTATSDEIWLVPVTLDGDAAVPALTAATVIIQLPAQHPLTLMFGG